jgi:hypothetical protein
VTRPVTIGGVGNVPANATAVALNVTVTDTAGAGYLTLYPYGTTRPVSSSINWAPGTTVANAVTVPVGSNGQIDVYGFGPSVDVIFDVVGYYDQSPGDGLIPVSPHRIVDSRPSSQVGAYSTPWTAGTSRRVQVAGINGIPADADAVVLNVTATDTSDSSYLTVSPAGQQVQTSSLNWVAGDTVPNAVTAKVGSGGAIDVFNHAGSANVVIDIAGYFVAGQGAQFHPVAPTRVLDTRPDSQVGPYRSPLGPSSAVPLIVRGTPTVPAGAVAAQTNVTVTDATWASYLTVWPYGQWAPRVSSLNWRAGQTVANSVLTPLGDLGIVWYFNHAGSADVVVDVSGWYG